MNSKPHIWSIDKLLGKNLIIPDYQRPYKWTDKNITELILDTQKSIEESRKYANFKYRIGTVILHPQIRNPTKVSERCGPNRQECDFSSLD